MQEAKHAHPYTIGEKYLIRTVTHYYTGLLTDVFEHELVLENAAWIADTGRYTQALEQGTLEEVEPVRQKIIIGRGAIVDCAVWNHRLPDEVK